MFMYLIPIIDMESIAKQKLKKKQNIKTVYKEIVTLLLTNGKMYNKYLYNHLYTEFKYCNLNIKKKKII